MILQYKVACKNCLTTNHIPRIINLIDYDENFFNENNEIRPEYEITKYIRYSFSRYNQICGRCLSTNFEIMNILINNKEIERNRYDKYFELDILHDSKRLEVRKGGSENLPRGFEKDSLSLIIEELKTINQDEFINHQSGTISFIVAEYFDKKTNTFQKIIESLNFVGYHKLVAVKGLEQLHADLFK